MAVTEKELRAFHQFCQKKLHDEGADNLHELVDSWEVEHATPEEHAKNVTAVQAAIDDMRNGDCGRPAGELIKELRSELTPPE